MTTQSNVTIKASGEGFKAIIADVNRLHQAIAKLGGVGASETTRQLQQTFAGRQQLAREYIEREAPLKPRGEANKYWQGSGTQTGQLLDRLGRPIGGSGTSPVSWLYNQEGLQSRATPPDIATREALATSATDVLRPDVVAGSSQEKALRKMNEQFDAATAKGKMFERQQKELGHAAKISAKSVLDLRVSIEKLQQSQTFQAQGTHKQVSELKVLDAQLKQLQAQTVQNTSNFAFMAGSSMNAQNRVRTLGAAAQGSMLAMSALNGDIMGLAFSLIFLQFAANLRVALGFGAVAVAGVFAFKAIKKIYDKKQEVQDFTDAWYQATGSVHSFALAGDQAEHVIARLGITGRLAAESEEAAVAAMLDMQRRDQDVTDDKIKLAVQAYLIAKKAGQEEAEAHKSAMNAVQDSYHGREIVIAGYATTLDKINQETARILSSTEKDFMSAMGQYGKTVKEAFMTMGLDSEEAGKAAGKFADMEISAFMSVDNKVIGSTAVRTRLRNRKHEMDKNSIYEQEQRLLETFEQFDRENKAAGELVSDLKKEDDQRIDDMWAVEEEKRDIVEALKLLDKEYVTAYASTIEELKGLDKQLTDYWKDEGIAESKMAMSDYETWTEMRGGKYMKGLDVEYRTGQQMTNTTLDYNKDGDLQFIEAFNESGNREEIHIVLEDQTTGGLTAMETVYKQTSGVIVSNIGMASESGNF